MLPAELQDAIGIATDGIELKRSQARAVRDEERDAVLQTLLAAERDLLQRRQVPVRHHTEYAGRVAVRRRDLHCVEFFKPDGADAAEFCVRDGGIRTGAAHT